MGRTDQQTSNSTPIITSAYKVISGGEDEFPNAVAHAQYIPQAQLVTANIEEFNAPAPGKVSGPYANLPEARNITWTDKFFEDEDDVVAVFDLDYDNMESYFSKLGWCVYGSTFFCSGIFWTGFFLGVPCFLNRNVKWNVRNQHVAITRNGILFVHAKRPSCWGLPCTDVGKTTKLIPFDKIADCKVIEAAGNTCLCIDNTLDNIVIKCDREGSVQPDVLNLHGLKNPHGFQKLVMAMKRAYSVPASLARMPATMERGEITNADTNADVATLLREIRDELRERNETLQSLKQPAHPFPTAPPSSKDIV